MSHSPHPLRRRRVAVVTVIGLVFATIAATFGASPVAASTAPLATTDGIGIRVDENAILGPALEAIETELQPVVNQMITDGAIANSVMDDPDWADGSANLELSFDFVNAGTPGYPQGGLKVHADLEDIRMRFYRYGAWWQPECLIYVEPEDGAIDASAYIDTSKLPAAPLTLNPIDATWDNDPSAGPAPGYSWTCNGYLIDEWWDGLWGDGSDVAAQLEAELNGEAQELVDALWDEHVVPVVDSLDELGITFNQVRTDDHGLIVTANTDATGGLALPGAPGGPYDVSATPESGASSNVNTLLANRGEVIVSVHPNVVNQYLNAVNQLSGQFMTITPISSSIEDVLLNPADRAAYSDTGWRLRMKSTTQYYVTPSGAGGAPLMQVPSISLEFRNTSTGAAPVATFTGSFTGLPLITELRSGASDFGPSITSTAGSTLTLTRTQANAAAAAVAPQTGAQLKPAADEGIVAFNANTFLLYFTVAPISIGGLNVNLCTTCGRYSGDQRYTETFTVG